MYVIRIARRFVQRDVPLDARFQRGIRAGFFVAAGPALGTLVLTEITSTSLERDVAAQFDLAEQRGEVARLGSLLPLLAGTDDLAEADELRVEIGARVESVAAQQIANPELLELHVIVSGNEVRFDRAFERMVDRVGLTVEKLADESLFPSFRLDAVSEVVSVIAALDPVYASLETARAGSGLGTASHLRGMGRILASVGLTAAVLRLLVLGRPLVTELRGLRTTVGIADTRRARTAHAMMALIGEELAEARADGRGDVIPDEESSKILPGQQLSTP